MRKFKNPFAINENKEVIYIKNGDIENKDKYKIWGGRYDNPCI